MIKHRALPAALLGTALLLSACTMPVTDPSPPPSQQVSPREQLKSQPAGDTAPQDSSPDVSLSPSPSPSPVPSETPTATPNNSKFAVEFSTPILKGSTKNRNNNLKLAAKALNGSVVKAGEEFSYNGTLGPRTEAKGYKEAHIFVGDEEVDEVGGGICQVASTLYNAALNAGFKITERHQHGQEVYYIELGRDATVFYGQLDLRFVNTKDFDVKIGAKVTRSKVVITMKKA